MKKSIHIDGSVKENVEETTLTAAQILEIKETLSKVNFRNLIQWATNNTDQTNEEKVKRWAGYFKSGNAITIKKTSINILKGVQPDGEKIKYIENPEVFKDFIVNTTARLIVCNHLAHKILNPQINQNSLEKQIEDHFIKHCPEEGLLIRASHDPNKEFNLAKI